MKKTSGAFLAAIYRSGVATQPMKKGDRIEAYVKSLGLKTGEYDPCYLGYFVCFNAGEYYEAHDVLEHLWLQGKDANHAFYKSLIQFAGAFVHLKKQHERPWHPKDARRMHPAVRLFALVESNMTSYAPEHLGLNVTEVLELARDYSLRIKSSDYEINPWKPGSGPHLKLHSHPSW